jgi:hypothetical protein
MPTVIVSMPQSNFQGGFDSLSLGNPLQLPADCESITCSLDMPAADRTDALNAVKWDIYLGPTAAGPWTHIYGPEYWQGGTHTARDGTLNVPNSSVFSYGIDPAFRGQYLRATGTVNHRQQLGCTVTSNP